MRWHDRVPRRHDTGFVTHRREPVHIILDSERYSVEHRRKAVVEQPYYLIIAIHSISQIVLTFISITPVLPAKLHCFVELIRLHLNSLECSCIRDSPHDTKKSHCIHGSTAAHIIIINTKRIRNRMSNQSDIRERDMASRSPKESGRYLYQ